MECVEAQEVEHACEEVCEVVTYTHARPMLYGDGDVKYLSPVEYEEA